MEYIIDNVGNMMHIIESFEDRFDGAWKINNNKKKIMEMCCEVIDRIDDEYECGALRFSVDNETKDIAVLIEVEDCGFTKEDEFIKQLIKNSKFFMVNKADHVGYVNLILTFPGIWDEKR